MAVVMTRRMLLLLVVPLNLACRIDPTFTAIAREKGQAAVVVGTVVAGATYWGVTWNENIHPTKTAIGLKGLRIATYEVPSTNNALMAETLKENRQAVGDARIVQGSYGTLLAMLKAGKAGDEAGIFNLEALVSKRGGQATPHLRLERL